MTYAYQSHTANDRSAMLERIGVASVSALFETIPNSLRLREALPLGAPSGDGLTEIELERLVRELVADDTPATDAVSFLGCGSYDHFIPAAVDALASDGRFVTAYTPYQAEASQGSLQVFFEYQSLVARLTGMDIANASHYDVATACVEAALMATAATQRKIIVVAESVHSEYRAVLSTVLAPNGIEIVTLPTPNGRIEPQTLSAALDSSVACVIVQHPNFFGGLEDVVAIGEQVHNAGGLFVVCVDPISLGVLKNPASYGADIVVAEGQPLGIPMSFGGPYLGVMACRESLMRRIPGRLVGQTCDRRGERCWVLTMQTREQHIRRDKAASNICSNQGLMAIRAAIYLALVGPQGLREVAEHCTQKAHYLASQLPSPLKLAFDIPFFKECVVRFPSEEILQNCCDRAADENIFAGVPLSRFDEKYAGLLAIAVTEKRTREEIDDLVRVLKT